LKVETTPEEAKILSNMSPGEQVLVHIETLFCDRCGRRLTVNGLVRRVECDACFNRILLGHYNTSEECAYGSGRHSVVMDLTRHRTSQGSWLPRCHRCSTLITREDVPFGANSFDLKCKGCTTTFSSYPVPSWCWFLEVGKAQVYFATIGDPLDSESKEPQLQYHALMDLFISVFWSHDVASVVMGYLAAPTSLNRQLGQETDRYGGNLSCPACDACLVFDALLHEQALCPKCHVPLRSYLGRIACAVFPREVAKPWYIWKSPPQYPAHVVFKHHIREALLLSEPNLQWPVSGK
jgi:hypothetical protein